MSETQQILNTDTSMNILEDRVSKLSLDKKDKNKEKEKSDKKVKKELSSDIKILEDKKKKPIKKAEDIKCGFPLITKKGEKCTNKGLSECGGRCKMHNGK